MKLTDFKVLTFDCYGTLIDWESGMVEALRPLTTKVRQGLSRNEILEAHARHESSQQLQTPAKAYCDLLAIVYRRLAEEWGVPVTWSECVTYGHSVRNWPAFVDSASLHVSPGCVLLCPQGQFGGWERRAAGKIVTMGPAVSGATGYRRWGRDDLALIAF